MTGFHDFGLRMPAQEPGGKHYACEFGLGRPGRQSDNYALQLATLDALEHLGHDVMVPALDEFGPHLAHEGQEAPTRFILIAGIGAQEEVQMTGKLSALVGCKTLVIEELRVILDPTAFAGSGGAHGAI